MTLVQSNNKMEEAKIVELKETMAFATAKTALPTLSL